MAWREHHPPDPPVRSFPVHPAQPGVQYSGGVCRPLILLAGNRASHRDRLTLEHAAAEGELADAQNERLLNGNTEILKHVAALEARILSMEQTIVAAVSGTPPVDHEP